jgi:hypothetical protein
MHEKFGSYYTNNLQLVGRIKNQKESEVDHIIASEEDRQARENHPNREELERIENEISKVEADIALAESEIIQLEAIRDRYIGNMPEENIVKDLEAMVPGSEKQFYDISPTGAIHEFNIKFDGFDYDIIIDEQSYKNISLLEIRLMMNMSILP